MKNRFIPLLAATLVLAGCSGSGEEPNAGSGTTAEPATKVVRTARADELRAGSEVKFLGRVEAASEGAILARVAGTLGDFTVNVGDDVRAGQTVGRITPDGRSTADVEKSNAASSLAATRTSSSAGVAAAEAALAKAKVAEAAARTDLGNTKAAVAANEEANRRAVEQAEVGVENARTAKENAILNAATNEANAREDLRRALASLELDADDWQQFLDAVLGLEAATKHENDTFESYLAALNKDLIRQATEAYRALREARTAFSSELKAESATLVLETGRDAANLVLAVLDASIEDADRFPRATINSYRTSIQSVKSSVDANRTAIESAEQALTTSLRTNATSLDSAANAVTSAEASLRAARAQAEAAIAGNRRSIEAAEAALDQAGEGVTAAQRAVEQARAQGNQSVTAAQSALRVAGVAADNFAVIAQADGKVTEVVVRAGGSVTAGQTIAKLATSGALRVRVDVPEELARDLRIGSLAEVGGEIGEIGAIGSEVDPATRRVAIEVRLGGETKLSPGSLADVTLHAPSVSGNPRIPFSLLRFSDESPAVLVASGGIAALEPVTLGETSGAEVEILSGLDADDLVILDQDVMTGEQISSDHQ